MESSRSKRRRLISMSSSYISLRPDLPAIFESLNDDTLTSILEFVGDKSYRSFGGVNKHCKEIYLNKKGMTKETFLYGYAPLSVITDRYDSDPSFKVLRAVSKGVVFYNRRDVMNWALEERKKNVLIRICNIAAKEERIDLLEDVLKNIDEENRTNIFSNVCTSAACYGKLEVLKWLETKGQGLKLSNGYLYNSAINGGDHLHVMKWLREEEVDWSEKTFYYAVRRGNLDVLQWLNDEGCPWHEDDYVYEEDVEPEILDWCRVNGYSDNILVW